MRSTMMSGRSGRISISLVLSYVLDWLVIILAVAVGAVFSIITPNKRPFSLADPNISFPHVKHEKVSLVTIGFACLVAPAIIIMAVCLVLVPGPTVPKSTPKGLIWRRKLWEWHTGWLGLALSLGAAFLITNGMKNLFGKPRPDLLSRCEPDLANIARYAVGGFSNTQTAESTYLVSNKICMNTDKDMMDDGFRSFPSGHSSFSSAGLIYLSLFLASKLAISAPFLAPTAYSQSRYAAFPSRSERRSIRTPESTAYDKSTPTGNSTYISGHDDAVISARNHAAAPPVYLLIIVAIPTFSAIYIASTRWSDFRHHGFDILFGFLIGTLCAVFSFRFYHLPINQGAGWSWGPRSRDRAFWAGVGVGNYAGNRSPDSVTQHDQDIEMGTGHTRGDSNVQDNIELLPRGVRSDHQSL
ncbi:pap2 domain containing protein [Phlyctema vagabunda]|uniref:Pap2 domain containing protein n=1 Tax=Phlyctema vagabunda TaxID=108571 RepID=A0ABR4PWP9_9HELO